MNARAIRTGLCAALGAASLARSATPALAAPPNEQYFPLQSYRVGPYAAGGSGFFGGFIDYLQLINRRDGGVNGVKLTWSECETEYVVERGVECYERLKTGLNGAPVAATNPLSVGIAYATIDRQTADKIPLITINHGRTDSTDGSVFPYIFPLQLNPYSEIAAIITWIGQKGGGVESLKGKKIVTLYHGSPYGKETIPILDLYAKKHGFQITHIEVPHPGNEQQSQWLTIRREKPDWVILRGWGVMNPVAIKTAAKTGFPVDHIIGNIWSNAEEDVRPAGPVGKGYIAITTGPSGTNFPVLRDIENNVVKAGKGDLKDPKRFGTLHIEPRFRDSRLRAFFPGPVWAQEVYASVTLAPGTVIEAGKAYSHFGLFWDNSFYGNVQVYDGLKLDPDYGLSLEGAIHADAPNGLRYYAQYFLVDGQTNVGCFPEMRARCRGPVERAAVYSGPFSPLGGEKVGMRGRLGAARRRSTGWRSDRDRGRRCTRPGARGPLGQWTPEFRGSCAVACEERRGNRRGQQGRCGRNLRYHAAWR